MRRSVHLLFLATVFVGIVVPACAKHSYERAGKIYRPPASVEGLDWDLEVGKIYESFLHHARNEGYTVDAVRDQSLLKRLQRILDRLKKGSQVTNLPFRVHLVDHEESNAACYPGGGIFFLRGIFDLQKDGFVDPSSDDEIAAVMSHEMSHAVLRHSYRKKKTIDRLEIARLIGSIATGAAGGETAQSLFQVVFDVSTGFSFPSYSRKHESEADLEGIIMMQKSGFDPDAAVKIWQRAMARGGHNATKTDFFASHPSNKKRAETLARQIAIMRAMGIEE